MLNDTSHCCMVGYSWCMEAVRHRCLWLLSSNEAAAPNRFRGKAAVEQFLAISAMLQMRDVATSALSLSCSNWGLAWWRWAIFMQCSLPSVTELEKDVQSIR